MFFNFNCCFFLCSSNASTITPSATVSATTNTTEQDNTQRPKLSKTALKLRVTFAEDELKIPIFSPKENNAFPGYLEDNEKSEDTTNHNPPGTIIGTPRNEDIDYTPKARTFFLATGKNPYIEPIDDNTYITAAEINEYLEKKRLEREITASWYKGFVS